MKEKKELIKKYLIQMEMLSGLKQIREMDQESIGALLDLLLELVERFEWLSVKRLEIVLKNGMTGNYGDFYSINVRTLSGWIHKYKQSNEHQIVMEITKSTPNAEPDVSDQEKEYWINMGKKRFRKLFEKAKNDGIIEDLYQWGPYWLHRMQSKGVLKLKDYPLDKIEKTAKRDVRIERKPFDSVLVASKVDNYIWREFIKKCIVEMPNLPDMVDGKLSE